MEVRMDIDGLSNLTLESLITQHRDRFQLRYANEQDLSVLTTTDASPADGRAVKNSFTDWIFITFEDAQKDKREVILTSVRPTGFTGTSPVDHFNREQGWVVTRSGSLYFLDGPAGAVPTDAARILFIAGLFNSWGIGNLSACRKSLFRSAKDLILALLSRVVRAR